MSEEHAFSAALGLDGRGKPIVRARCSCGWSEEIVGAWKNREDAEHDAKVLHAAHLEGDDDE